MSRVAELRKKKGLTQRQLGDACGVVESTVGNWESGRNGTKWFELVAKLCKALDCTPDELFQYEDLTADD